MIDRENDKRQTALKCYLSLVTFDDQNWRFGGENLEQQVKYWFTPVGDGVGLFFFALPPDLPQNASDLENLRAFYTKLVGEGGDLVELDVRLLDDITAVRTIIKKRNPHQPTGFVYVGSWIIPFRDFSYVLKSQCEERGVTGMREAILLDARLAEGEDISSFDSRNWNPAAEKWDTQFPNHPISRLRLNLSHLETTTKIAP